MCLTLYRSPLEVDKADYCLLLDTGLTGFCTFCCRSWRFSCWQPHQWPERRRPRRAPTPASPSLIKPRNNLINYRVCPTPSAPLRSPASDRQKHGESDRNIAFKPQPAGLNPPTLNKNNSTSGLSLRKCVMKLSVHYVMRREIMYIFLFVSVLNNIIAI